MSDQALDWAMGEIKRLQDRQQELLRLVARISQETPLVEELEGWQSQRASMISEIGTLKAALEESKRQIAQLDLGVELWRKRCDEVTAQRERCDRKIEELETKLVVNHAECVRSIDERLRERNDALRERDEARAKALVLDNEGRNAILRHNQLIAAFARLFVNAHLHSREGEDTVGVLMKTGAFQVSPDPEHCDAWVNQLAREIDAMINELGLRWSCGCKASWHPERKHEPYKETVGPNCELGWPLDATDVQHRAAATKAPAKTTAKTTDLASDRPWEYGCACGAWRSKDCSCGGMRDPRA